MKIKNKNKKKKKKKTKKIEEIEESYMSEYSQTNNTQHIVVTGGGSKRNGSISTSCVDDACGKDCNQTLPSRPHVYPLSSLGTSS